MTRDYEPSLWGTLAWFTVAGVLVLGYFLANFIETLWWLAFGKEESQ